MAPSRKNNDQILRLTRLRKYVQNLLINATVLAKYQPFLTVPQVRKFRGLGGKIGTDIATYNFLGFLQKNLGVTGGRAAGIAKRVFLR